LGEVSFEEIDLRPWDAGGHDRTDGMTGWVGIEKKGGELRVANPCRGTQKLRYQMCTMHTRRRWREGLQYGKTDMPLWKCPSRG